ncbi:MAG: hypothetical protein GY870_18430 [archaeon]|nr:hypothetical protein [archaeon]
MKIFRSSDGNIYQLADKEKIENWDAEMPLIFIGYVRDKLLQDYPKSIRSDVEKYLDDLLENYAIPKLIQALTSENVDERRKVAENMYKLSESNADQLKIALSQIEKANQDPDKKVADWMKKTLKNYQKAQKKKSNAAKRKKLKALRKKMDKFDIDFAEGKISDANYIKEQKNYLKLKREIEISEQID